MLQKQELLDFVLGDLARSGIDIMGVVSFHGVLESQSKHPNAQIKSSILVLHGWEELMSLPGEMVKLSQELNELKADRNIHV